MVRGYFPFFSLKRWDAFWCSCPLPINPLEWIAFSLKKMGQVLLSAAWTQACWNQRSLTPMPKNLTPIAPLETKKHLLLHLAGILTRENETQACDSATAGPPASPAYMASHYSQIMLHEGMVLRILWNCSSPLWAVKQNWHLVSSFPVVSNSLLPKKSLSFRVRKPSPWPCQGLTSNFRSVLQGITTGRV